MTTRVRQLEVCLEGGKTPSQRQEDETRILYAFEKNLTYGGRSLISRSSPCPLGVRALVAAVEREGRCPFRIGSGGHAHRFTAGES